ncbi:5'-nucleotidase C-terminal domain-containing protein [Mesorhizobium xinjiangense]|uniref:5'-nucleotidase C-terminal domain-containing protein n=1 Tax=Mesorhizobium xinjiangense TaxID=2678685 RepID=UPI0012ED5278|nr:5'-nucleotidase C-terminal domain-containing protein [Mesorhizobium xinjiangense]
MKKLAAIAALSASGLALSTATSFADYTLNILHINDWHSRIESINKYDSTCSAEDETEGKCFGGAARLVSAVRERRAALEGQNVLFLNAGDNFQGSLFYTTYKGAAEAEFLNQMATDAMAVGNHEFDDGEDGLATFLDAAEFPVLSANVKAGAASALGDRVKPYVVLEVGGERIGIVGAVANDTAELSSPGEHVMIEEDVATITKAVEAVEAEGVDKIIALTHVGYPRDLEAIAKIPGVDVVVGGHSHTFLSSTAEGAEGPYPTMVDNPDGHAVPVVQAGSYSKYLGDLKLVFDDSGVVTEAAGEPLLLDASVTPDETVLARVKELAAPIEDLKAQIIGETTAPIDGSRESCRARECEMGNLVADAMLDRVADQGIQIAVQNGGGLRSSIDEGQVTMGEVLSVLPFQNTLATFQLTGKDVVASLEGGVSRIEEGAGRFPQVAGLRYTFDASVGPEEGRITAVEVRENGEWAPIDEAKTYGVVTNNFMRNGGDGYALFKSNGQNAYDFGPGLEQVLADYLAETGPYTPMLEGRISAVPMPAEEEASGDDAAAAQSEAAATDGAVAMPDLPAMSSTLTSEPPSVDVEPTVAAAEPAEDAMAQDAYTIMAGDNYWKLAEKFYGDPFMWKTLEEANPDYRAEALPIGATLTVPPAN